MWLSHAVYDPIGHHIFTSCNFTDNFGRQIGKFMKYCYIRENLMLRGLKDKPIAEL